jgi:uncharacterized damage-inducible protein DinB
MDAARELLSLSDTAFERTWSRLAGLTDEEYRWEPVPVCWSVRVRHDGEVRADWAPMPESPPFTTIAWRLWHLITCYGQARNEQLLRGSAGPGGDERCAARPTAAAALAALAAAHDWWRALLTSLSEAELGEPMGPVAGEYADANRAAFVLHQIDEHVHHGAEVALLRDLYAATPAPARDSGDAGHRALHQLLGGHRPPRAAVDELRGERPDLVRWAAANGHWQAVPLLVELGFAVDAERDGAAALHHAAAAGEGGVARLLLDHGADVTRRDASFAATPSGWAEFFGRPALAAELRAAETAEH